ncbi:MAG: 5-formyltetrahydrofolate cyclo-ligase [Clostridiales bacterium]|nr:5-formyltetrahydrofolate cyclo-ligase [Clostridiales bacterium]
MNIQEEKARIRKEIKRRRADLSPKALAKIEKDLPEFIFAIDDNELRSKIKHAQRIALYRAFNGEVPVDGLAKAFMEMGIKCCFPRIAEGQMSFYDVSGLDDAEFEVSSFGIKEPAAADGAVDPSDIDIVVLPAVAYNEEGTRLGMGGGYYDRFIGAMGSKRPYLLGICYEFQICSDVPSEEQDISADFLALIPEEEYVE